MAEERLIKTHLIITDIHDEFKINWCGKLADCNPKIENGMPIFVIIGDGRRVELNTVNMKEIEKYAKKLTHPKGRVSVTEDSSRIYIKENDRNEKLVGVVTRKHIKQYAPMYDSVGYR